MEAFLRVIRSRLNSAGWALLLLVIIQVLNNFLSRELTIGRLAPAQGETASGSIYAVWLAFVALMLLAATVLWAINDRRRMRLAIFGITAVFTAQLFLAVLLLVLRLVQSVKIGVTVLLVDAIIIFVTNILVFTLWYWFIDSANTRFFVPTTDPSWDFLFPQRQATYPGYANWQPHFFDYVFLAFTTSVAFSPTDTLPLSHASKLLMMTQSAIAVITLTVVAGTAINALAGAS